jgi:hypothetical protein
MPLLPAAKIKKGQQDPRIYDTLVLVSGPSPVMTNSTGGETFTFVGAPVTAGGSMPIASLPTTVPSDRLAAGAIALSRPNRDGGSTFSQSAGREPAVLTVMVLLSCRCSMPLPEDISRKTARPQGPGWSARSA